MIWVCFFCGFFSWAAYGQSLDYLKPNNTNLVDQNIKKTEVGDMYLLRYDSTLSKEEILDFYRDSFIRQNIKEVDYNKRKDLIEGAFVFEGANRSVSVLFPPSSEGKTTYFVLLRDSSSLYDSKSVQEECKSCAAAMKKNKTLKIFENISSPHKVDFMPLYPGVKELEYVDWGIAQPPMLSIGYLTKSDSAQTVEFYLENMPGFGWELTDRQTHNNMYGASEWVSIVAPYTYCSRHPCENLLPEPIPPLKLRGETLTFVKEKEKCVITVHTFDDMVAKSKGTIYDLSIIEENGNTAIGIAYFYEGA
jgi:hypothetical protein